MTKEELLSKVNALIQEWRIILRLEHWDIRAKVVHHSEIIGSRATIRFNSFSCVATIHVADPDILETPELWGDFYSLEKTIVHELLHLVLAGMEDIWSHVMGELHPSARSIAEKQWEIASEQPVELLAKILTSMKGGDKNREV